MENSLFTKFVFVEKSNPEKIALHHKNKSVSYAQLKILIVALSGNLLRNGIRKGDRVIICAGNSVETIVSFWAVLMCGGIASILSDDTPPSRLAYTLLDSGARCIIVNSNSVNSLNEIGDERLHKSLVVITTLGASPVLNKSLFSSHSDMSDTQKNENIESKLPYVITEDLAVIIYTSGSTGDPKGVVMSHGNMICARDSVSEYLENTSEDIFACALPLSFDYGLYQVIMSMSLGGTLVLEKDMLLPLQLMKIIDEYKVTALPLVPVMIELFQQFSLLYKSQFKSIRYISNTGAALNQSHIAQAKKIFPTAKIYSMFGLTECKRCTYLPPDVIDRKPGSVGIAIPNTDIMIVREDGTVCNANEVGELVVRGATIMQGYWRKPEKTAEKLKEHPVSGGRCLFTGDYGYLDDEGYFYFKARKDDVVKIRGQKLIPREIEDLAVQFTSIKESSVICIKILERTEIILFISSNDDRFNLSEFINKISAKLKPFQRPSEFVILKSFPRNLNGKIDKLALKKLANKEKTADTDVISC